MNKVVIRETPGWGSTSIIVLAGGYGIVMVSKMKDSPDVAVIHDLVVHEGRREKGLGNRLLKEALAEAECMGAKVARLSVEMRGWQADWYRRHGFMLMDMSSFNDCVCYVMEKTIRSDAVEPLVP